MGVHTLSSDFVKLYGTRLGHLDVTSNMGEPFTCEECKLQKVACDLRLCDGTYPSNVGQSFPVGAQGMQHSCHRALSCTSCAKKPVRRRTVHWSLLNDRYLCSFCSVPPHRQDVWGELVLEPEFLLSPRSIHPSAPPEASVCASSCPHPAEVHDDRAATVLQRLEQGGRKYTKHGGDLAVQAAAALYQCAMSLFMPVSQQRIILQIIHELHDRNLLIQATPGKMPPRLILPRDVTALHERAHCLLYP